jgi:hypothetical protein
MHSYHHKHYRQGTASVRRDAFRPRQGVFRVCAGIVAAVALVLLSGCMDMFDPAGGAYARNRYVDPDAFLWRESRGGVGEVTYVFAPARAAGKYKLRSVYLSSQHANGPHLKYDFDRTGRLTVTVKAADRAKWPGFTIFGDYGAPEVFLPDARSVNISQDVYFERLDRESGGK